jgi:hypothetical protein
MNTSNPNERTRGERNNNPGNIDRNNIQWQGMSPLQNGDPRFVVFSDAVWGIRALAKLLLTYYRGYNLDTVEKLINRWAPAIENDTGAYARNVANLCGVKEGEKIDVTNPTTLKLLVIAIIKHENGRCIYKNDIITNGVMKALNH